MILKRKIELGSLGILLAVLSICYTVYSSKSESARDHDLSSFEMEWKAEEQAWFDSTMVQAARNDSLLHQVLDSLEAIGTRTHHHPRGEDENERPK